MMTDGNNIVAPTPTVADYPNPAAVLPMTLVQRAFEAGNLELVERAMGLQRRWEEDQAKKAFDVAMAAAQSEMTSVSRDASNPQTKSKYASMAALDRELRPIYSKHGFSISFDTEEGAPEGSLRIVCFVAAHGWQRKHHIDMPIVTKGPKGTDVMTSIHATMSAVTYGRRGLLKMVFNVAEGDDDDGNAAGGKVAEVEREPAEGLVTDAQAATLQHALEVRDMPVDRLLDYVNATAKPEIKFKSIADIPATWYDRCLARIETALQ